MSLARQVSESSAREQAGPIDPAAPLDPAEGTVTGGPTPARLAAGLLILAALGGSALGLAVWGGPLWRRATGGSAEVHPSTVSQPVGTTAPPAGNPALPASPLTERERYLTWWAKVGPNGRCVRCRHAMRVPTRGTAQYLCPVCQVASPARSIRAMGAPPPPVTPPPAYFLARGR